MIGSVIGSTSLTPEVKAGDAVRGRGGATVAVADAEAAVGCA